MAATSRHRHATFAAVAVLCATGILYLLLSGGRAAKGRATAQRPPKTNGSAAKPPVAAAPPAFPAASGFTTLTASGPGGDFAVQVVYPAARPRADAPVVRADAPYPLIVFSPGFDIDPSSYEALTNAWAAAGFVVAVPNYPFTGPGAAGRLREADIVNHPADMRAAIDGVLAASASPTGLLAGAVDPARVAAAGHSDGGDVTDAVVANTCCMDPRIKATAMFAGAELTSFHGEYEAISVPVLVVQGGADQVNAPACSQQIYRSARSARYYLDLPAAGHHAPYLQTGTPMTPAAVGYQHAVEKVSVLFWQAYLDGNTVARTELARLSSAPARLPGATLLAGSSVAAGGTCPGAPSDASRPQFTGGGDRSGTGGGSYGGLWSIPPNGPEPAPGAPQRTRPVGSGSGQRRASAALQPARPCTRSHSGGCASPEAVHCDAGRWIGHPATPCQ